MTSIFEGQPLKTRPFLSKTSVIWVPGRHLFFQPGGNCRISVSSIDPISILDPGPQHREDPRLRPWKECTTVKRTAGKGHGTLQTWQFLVTC